MKQGDLGWFFDKGRCEVYDCFKVDENNEGSANITYAEGTYEISPSRIFKTEREAAKYGLASKTREYTYEIRMLEEELEELTLKMNKIIGSDS